MGRPQHPESECVLVTSSCTPAPSLSAAARAAARAAAAMPPVPPKPPKKRYLMENPQRTPPVANGLLQLAEVSSQQRLAPSHGDPVNYGYVPSNQAMGHPLAGYAPQPRAHLNGGIHSRPPPCVPADEMPLNLTTAAATEVKLSRIVDRVVEKMLNKSGGDNGRSGDPLRLWFTNQFETRQKTERSSASPSPRQVSSPSPQQGTPSPRQNSSPSPRQKSVSPQMVSPGAVAGSPAQPSPGVLETCSADTGSAVMELRIAMSETIDRVIDNAYRQRTPPHSVASLVTANVSSSAGGGGNNKRCEVSSCSSDSVNSTTPLLDAPPQPPQPQPQPPPPRNAYTAKRRSPPATAVSSAARRTPAARARRVGSPLGPRCSSTSVPVTAPPSGYSMVGVPTPGDVEARSHQEPPQKRARSRSPDSPPQRSNDRVPPVGSEEDDNSRPGLVIDESRHSINDADDARPAASDAHHDAPDSRCSELSAAGVAAAMSSVSAARAHVERSSPLAADRSPGSPRRRPAKRASPADARLGDMAADAGGRGSRKRKVGKEEIIRIQKDDNENANGPELASKATPAKSKSQPK